MDWQTIAVAALKILGGALGAGLTGFGTTGTWQGAAVGAGAYLTGLFLTKPVLAGPATPPTP